MSLRAMVLDLVKELEAAREAKKLFETDVAQKALNEMITLIIEAAMEVSRCYSYCKLSTFLGLESFTACLISQSYLHKRVILAE